MDPQSLDRKYQVFVSSTFKDLSGHRQAAMQAIIKTGHIPIMLENYAPDTKDKATTIRTAIQAAQYFVQILGHRYGFVPKGRNQSYVELELDWAEEAGLPVLAFLMEEKLAKRKRKKLMGPEGGSEFENSGRYWSLRKRFTEAAEAVFFSPFTKASDIHAELLMYFSHTHDIPGYILEPREEETSILQLVAGDIDQIVKSVAERYGEKELLQALAKYLWKFEKEEDVDLFTLMRDQVARLNREIEQLTTHLKDTLDGLDNQEKTEA